MKATDLDDLKRGVINYPPTILCSAPGCNQFEFAKTIAPLRARCLRRGWSETVQHGWLCRRHTVEKMTREGAA